MEFLKKNKIKIFNLEKILIKKEVVNIINLWIGIGCFFQGIKVINWIKIEKANFKLSNIDILILDTNFVIDSIIIVYILFLYCLFFQRLKNILKKCKEIFVLVLGLIAILFLAYILKFFEINISIKKLKEIFIGSIPMFIFNIIPFITLLIIKCIRETRNEHKEKKLLLQRRKELEYFNKKLDRENVIGIEGEWGCGKSFFVEKLLEKRNLNEKVIKVNLILLENKEVIPLILKQLNIILKKNGIYYSHSEKLKRFLTTKIKAEKELWNIFDIFKNQTLSEEIEEYKESLKDLKKEIIIVFDDLDRIVDKEKIIRILNFGSEFGGEKLKVIYCYSQEELEKIDEIFTREFVEKFIPYTRKISTPCFRELLNKAIEEYNIKFNEINSENYRFINNILSGNTHGEEYIGYKNLKEYFREVFIRIVPFESNLSKVTMRKIEMFISESQICLNFLKEIKDSIKSEIVIGFYFIKYFLPDVYKTFYNINFKIETNYKIILEYERIASKKEINLDELSLLQRWVSKNYEEIYGKFYFGDQTITEEEIKVISKNFFSDLELEEVTTSIINEKIIEINKAIKNIKEDTKIAV